MKQALYWAGGAVLAFLLLRATTAKAATGSKSAAKNLIKSDTEVSDVLSSSSTSKNSDATSQTETEVTSATPAVERMEELTPRTIEGRLEYGTIDSEGKWTSSLERPGLQTPAASMPPERRRRRRRDAANFAGGNGDPTGRQKMVILDNTPFPIHAYHEDFDVDNFNEGGGL